jgi:hypothetical protein
VGAVGRLRLDGGVPPAVEVEDVIGGRQVQAEAAGAEREEEDRVRVPLRWNCSIIGRVPSPARRLQEERLVVEAVLIRSSRMWPISRYCEKISAASPFADDFFEHVDRCRSHLPDRPSMAFAFGQQRGVIADCLSRVRPARIKAADGGCPRHFRRWRACRR